MSVGRPITRAQIQGLATSIRDVRSGPITRRQIAETLRGAGVISATEANAVWVPQAVAAELLWRGAELIPQGLERLWVASVDRGHLIQEAEHQAAKVDEAGETRDAAEGFFTAAALYARAEASQAQDCFTRAGRLFFREAQALLADDSVPDLEAIVLYQRAIVSLRAGDDPGELSSALAMLGALFLHQLDDSQTETELLEVLAEVHSCFQDSYDLLLSSGRTVPRELLIHLADAQWAWNMQRVSCDRIPLGQVMSPLLEALDHYKAAGDWRAVLTHADAVVRIFVGLQEFSSRTIPFFERALMAAEMLDEEDHAIAMRVRLYHLYRAAEDWPALAATADLLAEAWTRRHLHMATIRARQMQATSLLRAGETASAYVAYKRAFEIIDGLPEDAVNARDVELARRLGRITEQDLLYEQAAAWNFEGEVGRTLFRLMALVGLATTGRSLDDVNTSEQEQELQEYAKAGYASAIGKFFAELDDYEQGLVYFQSVLDASDEEELTQSDDPEAQETLQKLQLTILPLVALMHRLLKNYDDALKNYQRSAILAQRQENSVEYYRMLFQKALVYEDWAAAGHDEAFANAIAVLEETARGLTDIMATVDAHKTYYAIARIHHRQGNLPAMREALRNAVCAFFPLDSIDADAMINFEVIEEAPFFYFYLFQSMHQAGNGGNALRILEIAVAMFRSLGEKDFAATLDRTVAHHMNLVGETWHAFADGEPSPQARLIDRASQAQINPRLVAEALPDHAASYWTWVRQHGPSLVPIAAALSEESCAALASTVLVSLDSCSDQDFAVALVQQWARHDATTPL